MLKPISVQQKFESKHYMPQLSHERTVNRLVANQCQGKKTEFQAVAFLKKKSMFLEKLV